MALGAINAFDISKNIIYSCENQHPQIRIHLCNNGHACSLDFTQDTLDVGVPPQPKLGKPSLDLGHPVTLQPMDDHVSLEVGHGITQVVRLGRRNAAARAAVDLAAKGVLPGRRQEWTVRPGFWKMVSSWAMASRVRVSRWSRGDEEDGVVV